MRSLGSDRLGLPPFLEGIMRCTAYSAAVNRALFIKPGEPGAKDTAIQHFDDKLFKIQGDAMKVSLAMLSILTM